MSDWKVKRKIFWQISVPHISNVTNLSKRTKILCIGNLLLVLREVTETGNFIQQRSRVDAKGKKKWFGLRDRECQKASLLLPSKREAIFCDFNLQFTVPEFKKKTPSLLSFASLSLSCENGWDEGYLFASRAQSSSKRPIFIGCVIPGLLHLSKRSENEATMSRLLWTILFSRVLSETSRVVWMFSSGLSRKRMSTVWSASVWLLRSHKYSITPSEKLSWLLKRIFKEHFLLFCLWIRQNAMLERLFPNARSYHEISNSGLWRNKKKEGSKKGKPDFVLAKRSQMDDFYSSLVLDFLTKDLSSIVLSYLDLCGDHREKSKSTNARTATNNIVL